MTNVYDEEIKDITGPLYDLILDDKAGFSANDVYSLNKILENYIDDLDSIEEGLNKEEYVITYTNEAIVSINELNKELAKFGFIMKEDQERLIKFFNDTVKDYGIVSDQDITKEFRNW